MGSQRGGPSVLFFSLSLSAADSHRARDKHPHQSILLRRAAEGRFRYVTICRVSSFDWLVMCAFLLLLPLKESLQDLTLRLIDSFLL